MALKVNLIIYEQKCLYKKVLNNLGYNMVTEHLILIIGSILNPLAGKFSEDTRKKCKGVKRGASHEWRSFYLSQYDGLKGSHMTKVVLLPNETDSFCEFVAPNTPY